MSMVTRRAASAPGGAAISASRWRACVAVQSPAPVRVNRSPSALPSNTASPFTLSLTEQSSLERKRLPSHYLDITSRHVEVCRLLTKMVNARPPSLSVTIERWPIAGAFTISRGAKTEAVVVVAELADGAARGRGECVPYARYGESVEAVAA